MARVVMSLAEWQAVSRELAGIHNATAPAGLLERIEALLVQAPQGWPDQPFALELDDSSVEAVQWAHASLLKHDPGAGQRIASVAEAVQIIHDHQQPS
jgi:hypothetical protein